MIMRCDSNCAVRDKHKQRKGTYALEKRGLFGRCKGVVAGHGIERYSTLLMLELIITQGAFRSITLRIVIEHFLVVPFAALLLGALMMSTVRAQSSDVQISVLSVSAPSVRIEGKRNVATRIWSFRNAYAGVLGIGERIENLRLTDASGVDVPVRKLAAGEYEASRDALIWTCEVKLDPPTIAADASHLSWIAGERGFLMLGDLLPNDNDIKNVPDRVWRVRLNLPATWNAFSNESKNSDGQFDVSEPEDAVFFVGKDLREQRERVGGTDCSLVTEGTWAFSDQDVMTMAVSVLKEYRARVGLNPKSRVTLMLSHFAVTVGVERWSAETRGGTVILLSGQSPSKLAGLAQLSVPITHELFHVWVPNGLSLAGNYDWFYEGFTLYEALCVSLRLGFVTFQDYLNTLGRAYDVYASIGEGRTLSLIDASQRRWTGPTVLIYQKGMLVAFLYDLSLRYITQGKSSLDDIYRGLFKGAITSETRPDGNEVVLGLLKGRKGLEAFVRSYVQGADRIDLKSMIEPFGLTVQQIGNRTRIIASDKLSGRQRDLLGAFGYNSGTRRARKRVS